MLPAIPLLVLMSQLAPAPTVAAVTPGEAIIRSAYKMSVGKWFKNAQWVQRTSLVGEKRFETWYVTIQPPGFMRSDVAPGVTGRALLYRNDSTYGYGRGTLRSKTADVEILSVLLHDLHTAQPEKTIALLKKSGFDLSRSHERMWDGEQVVVVGATRGDTLRNQFWLDKKRLMLVRLLQGNAANPRLPLDARITGYEKAGGGWLERFVKIYLGPNLTVVQEYSEVAIDRRLEDGLFDPQGYFLPAWVNGAKDIFGGIPNVPLPGRGGP